mmetsp:Transcript_56278/g.93071  ORF Transcript_56278/g.93071 Transcript_56278/m.93071 type:complete len:185 (+) Transcript_56278:27-581(+)
MSRLLFLLMSLFSHCNHITLALLQQASWPHIGQPYNSRLQALQVPVLSANHRSRLFTAGDNIAHVRCRIEMTGVPITSLSRLAAAIVGIFAVVRGAVTQAKASKTLATMTWADVSDVNDADACVLIGEEAEEDGRSWFACSDVPQDSDVECTLNDTNPNSPIATWLCKAPRVQAKQLFSHESAS